MLWLVLLLGLFPLAQQAAAQAVPTPSNGVPEIVPAVTAQPFDEWLQTLIEEARARGFSDEVVDETLKGLEPLPRVIERDRSQAELRPGFTRYSGSHLTRTMVQRGRDLMREHAGDCWRASRPITRCSAASWWPSGAWRAATAG